MGGYARDFMPPPRRRWFIIFSVLLIVLMPSHSFSASAKEIDASVDACLERFCNYSEANAAVLLKIARGVLVFVDVYKIGWLGGIEYGEGALRIDDKTVDYYNIMSASFGFIFGGQKKDVVILFMRDDALDQFRVSKGWEMGADINVALITEGAGASGDLKTLREKDIICYVLGVKGIMMDASLRGSKINKLDKSPKMPPEKK